MNDKELDLLKQVLESVGGASQQGFEHLVNYTFANGLVWTILGVVICLLATISLLIGIYKDFRDDDFNGLFAAISFFGYLIGIVFIGLNLTDVIEPAGAAVRALLSAARG